MTPVYLTREPVGILRGFTAYDPYTYLVDVLQRIDTHLAKDVARLTPRLWKERYAENPLRSEIDRPLARAALPA